MHTINKGDINLKWFEYLNTSDSSYLKGVWYGKENSLLVVHIKNNYYAYCGVRQNLWDDLKAVGSYGNFYSSNIKGLYSCSNNNQNVEHVSDLVFDHVIPLGLGGGDFSSASLSSLQDTLQTLPNYNESYSECLFKAIQEEPKILSGANYKRQPDGSWINENGEYPSSDLELYVENTVAESFKKCIN